MSSAIGGKPGGFVSHSREQEEYNCSGVSSVPTTSAGVKLELVRTTDYLECRVVETLGT